MRLSKPCRPLSHFTLPVLLLILFSWTSSAFPEESPDTQLFLAGFRANQRGDFPTAIADLSKVLNSYPATPLRDLTLFWLSNAHSKAGNEKEAVRYAAQLFREYPDSKITSMVDKNLAELAAGHIAAKPLPQAPDKTAKANAQAGAGPAVAHADPPPPSAFPVTTKPVSPQPPPPAVQTRTASAERKPLPGMDGFASYYPDHFVGKKTSSRQRYQPGKLTAAYPALPFGSKVKVVNLANGRSVVVTINDRCPKTDGRWINLSRAAAQRLGFYGRKTARVRIIPLEKRRGLS